MDQNKPTILIADDDIEDLELIEDAILGINPDINLHKMTNGKAVIDHLNRQTDEDLPCLIILDYNMPELSGPEVLEKICNEDRYNAIPKLILSTSNSPSYISECLDMGATEYFVKPNNLNDLQSLTARMLAYC